jgi:4-alpha-glucanotransferase
VCVLPLQDLLGLGDDARMNVPGVAEGNWSWQADGYDVEQALERTRELVELHASTH